MGLPPSQPSILIVDDEVAICKTVKMILDPAGYVVRMAHDGLAGLDAILSSPPDLVLCDIKLPGLNGFAMIDEARRKMPTVQSIPFIMLSGLNDEMSIRAGFKLGASDYLVKPFQPAVLKRAVANLLNEWAESPVSPVLPTTKVPAAAEKTEVPSAAKKANAAPKPEAVPLPTAIRAQVSLVSLEEVIEELGEDWPHIREKAMLIAEGVIRKSLSRGDSFSRVGDSGFNIIFRDNDEDRVRARIDVLEMNIRQRLLGGDQQVARAVDVAGEIDPRRTSAADESSAILRDPAGDRPTRTNRAVESQGDDPLAAPDIAWLRRQIKVVYRPIWYAGGKSVVAYQAYLMRKVRYGSYTGSKVLHGGATDPEALQLDLIVIGKVAEELLALPPDADAAMVGVPIHFSSLRADARDHLGEAFAAASPSVTQRMIIEIGDLPDIRGEMTVRWGIQFLRQFTERISVKVMPNDRHARLFMQSRATVFQLDLDEHLETRDSVTRADLIRAFVRESRRLGVQARVDGISMIDDFKAARGAKAEFACGPTIGWMTESPRQMYPLEDEQILGL